MRRARSPLHHEVVGRERSELGAEVPIHVGPVVRVRRTRRDVLDRLEPEHQRDVAVSGRPLIGGQPDVTFTSPIADARPGGATYNRVLDRTLEARQTEEREDSARGVISSSRGLGGAAMAEVKFDGVRKFYGDTEVIQGLDLEIHDHEFMVLVGPSGCGKSTVLRMLAGLEEISGGTISIGDTVVNRLPPKDRDIAMVFQSYALYPHMTIRENLEFGLRIRRTSKSDVDRLVSEAAEILEIGRLLDRKPRHLSGGERQRVAVGRAIVRQPAVFLFDEPLSNLDAKLRVQMRAEITKLQQRLNTTTVYVTHDQVEAMTMGHRIAILKDGDLQQVGTPLEVYERPANLFVATFIGSPPMNLLAGTLNQEGDAVGCCGFNLPVPTALRAVTRSRAGQEVTVGVRPEAIGESSRMATSATTTISVRVELVEPLGSENVVYARAGTERVTAKLAPHSSARANTDLTLAIDIDAIQLFDSRTSLRIPTEGS